VNDISVIILRGKRGGFTIVSAEDFDALNKFNWTTDEDGYVLRGIFPDGKRTTERMHRKILMASPQIEVDHRNHYLFDNTRRNLRPATRYQNSCNASKQAGSTSSRFKGVSWENSRSKWRARITVRGRQILLGYFENEEQAANVYNIAAKRLHRTFASLNAIEGR